MQLTDFVSFAKEAKSYRNPSLITYYAKSLHTCLSQLKSNEILVDDDLVVLLESSWKALPSSSKATFEHWLQIAKLFYFITENTLTRNQDSFCNRLVVLLNKALVLAKSKATGTSDLKKLISFTEAYAGFWARRIAKVVEHKENSQLDAVSIARQIIEISHFANNSETILKIVMCLLRDVTRLAPKQATPLWELYEEKIDPFLEDDNDKSVQLAWALLAVRYKRLVLLDRDLDDDSFREVLSRLIEHESELVRTVAHLLHNATNHLPARWSCAPKRTERTQENLISKLSSFDWRNMPALISLLFDILKVMFCSIEAALKDKQFMVESHLCLCPGFYSTSQLTFFIARLILKSNNDAMKVTSVRLIRHLFALHFNSLCWPYIHSRNDSMADKVLVTVKQYQACLAKHEPSAVEQVVSFVHSLVMTEMVERRLYKSSVQLVEFCLKFVQDSSDISLQKQWNYCLDLVKVHTNFNEYNAARESLIESCLTQIPRSGDYKPDSSIFFYWYKERQDPGCSLYCSLTSSRISGDHMVLFTKLGLMELEALKPFCRCSDVGLVMKEILVALSNTQLGCTKDKLILAIKKAELFWCFCHTICPSSDIIRELDKCMKALDACEDAEEICLTAQANTWLYLLENFENLDTAFRMAHCYDMNREELQHMEPLMNFEDSCDILITSLDSWEKFVSTRKEKLDTHLCENVLLLAVLFRLLDRPIEELKTLNLCLKLNPENPITFLRICELLFQFGHYDGVRKLLETVHLKSKDDLICTNIVKLSLALHTESKIDAATSELWKSLCDTLESWYNVSKLPVSKQLIMASTLTLLAKLTANMPHSVPGGIVEDSQSVIFRAYKRAHSFLRSMCSSVQKWYCSNYWYPWEAMFYLCLSLDCRELLVSAYTRAGIAKDATLYVRDLFHVSTNLGLPLRFIRTLLLALELGVRIGKSDLNSHFLDCCERMLLCSKPQVFKDTVSEYLVTRETQEQLSGEPLTEQQSPAMHLQRHATPVQTSSQSSSFHMNFSHGQDTPIKSKSDSEILVESSDGELECEAETEVIDWIEKPLMLFSLHGSECACFECHSVELHIIKLRFFATFVDLKGELITKDVLDCVGAFVDALQSRNWIQVVDPTFHQPLKRGRKKKVQAFDASCAVFSQEIVSIRLAYAKFLMNNDRLPLTTKRQANSKLNALQNAIEQSGELKMQSRWLADVQTRSTVAGLELKMKTWFSPGRGRKVLETTGVSPDSLLSINNGPDVVLYSTIAQYTLDRSLEESGSTNLALQLADDVLSVGFRYTALTYCDWRSAQVTPQCEESGIISKTREVYRFGKFVDVESLQESLPGEWVVYHCSWLPGTGDGSRILIFQLEHSGVHMSVHKTDRDFVTEFDALIQRSDDSMAYCDKKLWWERRHQIDDDMLTLVNSFNEAVGDSFKAAKRFTSKDQNGTVILVLDKYLQRLPIECVPDLRLLPVCRIPCLRYLSAYFTYSDEPTSLDPQEAFFVLNPQNNLPQTQEMFETKFQSQPNWEGLIAKGPTPNELKTAFSLKDLYVYCGHGSGSQYSWTSLLYELKCKAAPLLMGCSSGELDVLGEMPPQGIVLKYLVARAPCVLAVLWAVTDKDIDRFFNEFLDRWVFQGEPGKNICEPGVMLEARKRCKLPAIIGFAPVVYGLPTRIH